MKIINLLSVFKFAVFSRWLDGLKKVVFICFHCLLCTFIIYLLETWILSGKSSNKVDLLGVRGGWALYSGFLGTVGHRSQVNKLNDQRPQNLCFIYLKFCMSVFNRPYNSGLQPDTVKFIPTNLFHLIPCLEGNWSIVFKISSPVVSICLQENKKSSYNRDSKINLVISAVI